MALTGLAFAAAGRPRRRVDGAPKVAGEDVISLRALSKHYGPVEALAGIDLQIGSGSTVALLGPNGAGKSTAIEVLLSLLDAEQGSAHLFGSSPARAIASGRVGRCSRTPI